MYNTERNALANCQQFILTSIDSRYMMYTRKANNVREMVQALKKRIAPTDAARKTEAQVMYQKVLKSAAQKSTNGKSGSKIGNMLCSSARKWNFLKPPKQCRQRIRPVSLASVDDDKDETHPLEDVTSISNLKMSVPEPNPPSSPATHRSSAHVYLSRATPDNRRTK